MEQRRALIDLALGDPCYEPPYEARAAAAHCILHEQNGYLAPGGLPSLRSALAVKLQTRNGIRATADQVVVTAGASMALFATLAVVCEPTDGMLVPEPGFPLYRLMADTLRLRPLPYPLRSDADYEPDWEALSQQAPQARLLVWNFPSNPLGTVARPEWLSRLHALLDAHPHLYVISDEVYEDLIFHREHRSPAADSASHAERFFTIFSFSKSYAMAGWRVGYVHAPEPWATAIQRAGWAMAMSAPTIAQHAARAALRAPSAYHRGVMEFLTRNRDQASNRLAQWRLPSREPEGGFFFWVNILSSGLDAPSFAARCATECAVIVSPGTHFGASESDYIRLSFAVDIDSLLEGIDRIGRCVRSLRTSEGRAVGGDSSRAVSEGGLLPRNGSCPSHDRECSS